MQIKSYLFVINRTVRFFVASHDLILINCAAMKKFFVSVLVLITIAFVWFVGEVGKYSRDKEARAEKVLASKEKLKSSSEELKNGLDAAITLLEPEWERGSSVSMPQNYVDLRPDVEKLKADLDTLNSDPSKNNYELFERDFKELRAQLRAQNGESLGIEARSYNALRRVFTRTSL